MRWIFSRQTPSSKTFRLPSGGMREGKEAIVHFSLIVRIIVLSILCRYIVPFLNFLYFSSILLDVWY